MTVPRTEGLGQRLSRLLVILACALSGGLLAGYAGAAIAAILAILGYEGLSRPIRAALLRSYLKSPPASGKPPISEPLPGAVALLGFCLSFDPVSLHEEGTSSLDATGDGPHGDSGDATHGRRAQGMRRLSASERLGVLGGLILVDGWECDATDAGRALEELWDIVKDDASEMDSAALAALAARRIGSWRLPALAALRLYRSAGGDEEAARLVEAWLLRAGCSRSAWEDARAYASASAQGAIAQVETMPQSSTLRTRAPREQRRSVSRS